MKNYYKVLGIKISASDVEIKQAYRNLAKTLHPDHNRNNPNAESQLADINEAYEVLSDRNRRAEYNTQLNMMLNARSAPVYGQAMRTGYTRPGQGPRPQYGFAQNMNMGGMNAAQAAAAEQAAITNALNQSYSDGYSKGYSDAQARLENELNSYKNEIATLKIKLRDQEKETEEADREIETQSEKLAKLIVENERLKLQASEMVKSEKDKEYTAAIEKMQFELSVANTQLERYKEKIKQTEDVLFIKTGEASDLMDENTELKAKLAEYEEFADKVDTDAEIQRIIYEREIKLKEDKKTFKDTYYGALGVLFWEDFAEIEKNYQKLKKRYSIKAAAGDEKFTKKLNDLETAYAALKDPAKRKKYNAGLKVTEEDVEHEKQLAADYDAIVSRYHQEKADEEFWAYVDELMLLSQSGDAEAQNTLGELYYYGDELEQDLEQAFYWFKEAAKQHNPTAIFNMGQCYLNGEGTDKDEAKGMGFIKQAAKMGSMDADIFIKSKGQSV